MSADLALFCMTSERRAWTLGREAGLWAISLLLVTVFLRAGVAKMSATSGWGRAFTFWGYPPWFRLLIGVAEMAASASLLWPRTAAYGAGLIIVVMLGGMGTHLFVEHRPERATSELLQLIFAAVTLIGRWRQRVGIGASI